MKLNHINLVLPDVAGACHFFEQYFGFTTEEIKGDNRIAVLKGTDGFVLVLMSAALEKTGQAGYPGAFHIGFLQETHAAVTEIYDRLLAGGHPLDRAPQKIRDSFGFYFHLDSLMIEVSAQL